MSAQVPNSTGLEKEDILTLLMQYIFYDEGSIYENADAVYPHFERANNTGRTFTPIYRCG